MTTKSKLYDYVVTGKGTFPTDMLRHDQSWPASSRDVDLLHMSDERRTVKLRTYSRFNVTDGRWASFGWTVGAAS